MNRKGVCYDAGRVMMGGNWRPKFDEALARREQSIIKDDLHCDAVRICGLDIDRLIVASQAALDEGLEVWFCPEMWDRSQDETLEYIARAAERAEGLRQRWPGKLVFSVGSELTLFSQGMIEGKNVFDRISRPSFWGDIMAGKHNGPLNAYLSNLSEAAEVVPWPADLLLPTVRNRRLETVRFRRGRPLQGRTDQRLLWPDDKQVQRIRQACRHRGVRVLHFPGRGPARSQRLHDKLRDDGRPPRAEPEAPQDVLGYGACPAPSRRTLHP